MQRHRLASATQPALDGINAKLVKLVNLGRGDHLKTFQKISARFLRLFRTPWPRIPPLSERPQAKREARRIIARHSRKLQWRDGPQSKFIHGKRLCCARLMVSVSHSAIDATPRP